MLEFLCANSSHVLTQLQTHEDYEGKILSK